MEAYCYISFVFVGIAFEKTRRYGSLTADYEMACTNENAHADTAEIAQEERRHKNSHVVYVCTGCNFSKTLDEKNGRRGGNILWHAVMDELVQRTACSSIHFEPVACLSVCRDSCAVAFTARKKYTYTFGWLSPEPDSAKDLLDMAELYVASATGHIDRQLRPAKTSRLISKVPPPEFDPNIDDDVRHPRTAAQVKKPLRNKD